MNVWLDNQKADQVTELFSFPVEHNVRLESEFVVDEEQYPNGAILLTLYKEDKELYKTSIQTVEDFYKCFCTPGDHGHLDAFWQKCVLYLLEKEDEHEVVPDSTSWFSFSPTTYTTTFIDSKVYVTKDKITLTIDFDPSF